MKEYILRECLDGSFTFLRPDVGEAYHHPAGAALEAREKFIGALDQKLLAKKKRVAILDVCYGLGYNSAAAIEKIWGYNPSCNLVIVGLEIDPVIVRKFLEIPFMFTHKEVFEQLIAQYDKKSKIFSFDNQLLDFKVLIGDARRRVQEVECSFDIIFFDPFSPRKAPHLWTQKFFDTMFSVCAKNGSLVTYSCARVVRDRLRASGFVVSDGPVVGRRGPATIATKSS